MKADKPTPSHPLPDAYEVDFGVLAQRERPHGRLLAGPFPGAASEPETQLRVNRLLDEQVALVVDLTESGETDLIAYVPYLEATAELRQTAVTHRRHSIHDYGTPTADHMRAILDAIDQGLAAGQTVYVHCLSGRGRTGTVIGCWLARHALTGEQALAAVAALRKETPNGHRPSPETSAQRNMVRNY